MGYEIKLIIGLPSNMTMDDSHPDVFWLNTSAELDLCKPGYSSEIYKMAGREKPRTGTKMFFYQHDGNTMVHKDRYDDDLVAIPIFHVLQAVKNDSEKDTYHRFKWAVALLEAIAATAPDSVVVLFGY
jgi:hypothetical protein